MTCPGSVSQSTNLELASGFCLPGSASCSASRDLCLDNLVLSLTQSKGLSHTHRFLLSSASPTSSAERQFINFPLNIVKVHCVLLTVIRSDTCGSHCTVQQSCDMLCHGTVASCEKSKKSVHEHQPHVMMQPAGSDLI